MVRPIRRGPRRSISESLTSAQEYDIQFLMPIHLQRGPVFESEEARAAAWHQHGARLFRRRPQHYRAAWETLGAPAGRSGPYPGPFEAWEGVDGARPITRPSASLTADSQDRHADDDLVDPLYGPDDDDI